MVDTINPQTGREDNFQTNVNPQGVGVSSNSFYSGFNKPEDVHVNLADSTGVQPQTQTAPQSAHRTYSAGSTSGLKIFAIILGGLFTVILVSTATYFIAKSIYDGKLATAQEELSRLDSELNNAGSNPVPLELPLVQEPPAAEVETPAPTPPVIEEEPLEKPAEASPSITNGGQG